ncbi:MAG: adenylate kinase [Oscillospiraceae bacterium]|nr:adenylate kinase [Oscillospiraceae bacterium]
MIILIGGSSHVGKTLISQKLMEKLGFPYLSLDHLKMMFIRKGLTGLTVSDDYEMRYFLFPYAAEIIKVAVENGQNMIVEGCYIPSEWKREFSAEYLRHIRAFFITMSEKYLTENAEKLSRYADVIEKRVCDEIDIPRLINCSREFREECAEFGNNNIDIDAEYDADKIVKKILDAI